MAKMSEPIALPESLAALRASGADTFCRSVFPNEVRHWPSWITHESTEARIRAVVDSAETPKAESESAQHPGRRSTRLSKGTDTLEAHWEQSWTEVYLRPHRAATFGMYATIMISWNGQQVLKVRMGSDYQEFREEWHLIAVEEYQTGPWLDLVRRINETVRSDRTGSG